MLSGVFTVQKLTGDEPENRIAKKLQTLVRLARTLSRNAQVRTVRECQLQQFNALEADTIVPLKRSEGLGFLIRRRARTALAGCGA